MIQATAAVGPYVHGSLLAVNLQNSGISTLVDTTRQVTNEDIEEKQPILTVGVFLDVKA